MMWSWANSFDFVIWAKTDNIFNKFLQLFVYDKVSDGEVGLKSEIEIEQSSQVPSSSDPQPV